MKLVGHGTCDLCGEEEQDIYECEDLHEVAHGCACKSCCEYWIEERESEARIDDEVEYEHMFNVVNGWG